MISSVEDWRYGGNLCSARQVPPLIKNTKVQRLFCCQASFVDRKPTLNSEQKLRTYSSPRDIGKCNVSGCHAFALPGQAGR
jgi:hypothetical protein